MARSVIITCAITGSLHTPSMSRASAYHAGGNRDRSIEAAQAGASILHLHARNPANGRPTADPAVFQQFLPVIRAGTDAVVNITTGGAPGMTMDDRLAAPEAGKPGDDLAQHGVHQFRPVSGAGQDEGVPLRLGKALSRRLDGSGVSQHLRRHREHHCTGSARATARASNSNATTSVICTISHGSWTRNSTSRRCSSSSAWGYWAGSAPNSTICCTWCAPRSDCSATKSNGRCWRPAGIRCRWPRRTSCLAAMPAVGLEDSLYLERGRLAATNAEQVRKIVRYPRRTRLHGSHARRGAPAAEAQGPGADALLNGPRSRAVSGPL